MFTLGGAKLFKVICILCFLKSEEEEITARNGFEAKLAVRLM